MKWYVTAACSGNRPYILYVVMKKQVHAYYSGRVQGVGFRFTTESIANDLGVTGWVKNLSDGRVEVVVEAEEDVLKELLEKISVSFLRYIRDADVQWFEATGEFKDFVVRGHDT